ncbi:MAG TPA: polysaccharide biosynthesis tyrosine autokinase [Hyphomicrobiaceae bacterium]|nr:polysaccharide biosynthesis tyrosine autokinase [Hyphomicrobiaceae bacterium]
MQPIGLSSGGRADSDQGLQLRSIARSQLREVLGMLRRHRALILGTVAVLTGLVSVIVFQLTPKYKAEALVLIEGPKTSVIDLRSVVTGLPYDQDRINSEVAVITSRTIASRIVRDGKLMKDEEFNLALRERRGIMTWIRSLIPGSDKPISEQEKERLERQNVVDLLAQSIVVTPQFQSRVISMSIISEDPNKSAQLTNLLVDTYLVDQLEAKFTVIQRTSSWLGSRIATLQRAVEGAERAVEAYRQKFGLIKGKEQETAVSSRITNLNGQLVIARVKRAEAQARLEALESAIKSRGGIESVAAVQSSSLIQQLRLRESTVIGRLAELSSEFGRKHPKIIAVRAELADLRAKIRLEVLKIVSRVRGEVQIARSGERAIAESLAQLEGAEAALNRASVGLRALEREAEANRALLKTMLARLKETSAQRGIQSADARVISRATIPSVPYFPRTFLFIGVAMGASLIVGLGLAVGLEQIDSGFRSSDQIEQMTGYPTIGLIPNLESKLAKTGGVFRFIDENPVSQYAESIRNVHVGLALSNVDQPPKRILITSAMSGEGKSTTAFALARVAALAGKRSILVDCDLRNPTSHSLAGLPRSPGLVDVITGNADLKTAIQSTGVANFSVLPAGDPPTNPSDLLMSERMKRLIIELSEQYDLVVLDSPPVMAVSDPRILAPQADTIIFVVRWAKTKRENVVHSIRQLADNGAKIAGVVVTQVNVKKHAEYDYGDSGYYSSRYSKYYTT